MNMQEIWKPIPFNPDYSVSSLGRIRRETSGKGTFMGLLHKPAKDHKGYLRVSLRKDGAKLTHKVHRLVAHVFIENPNNLSQVNHINGIKSDNRPENLEWCTNVENQLHAIRIGLKGTPYYKGKFGSDHNRSIAIEGTSLMTGEVRVFGSCAEAVRLLGLNRRSLNYMLSGEYKHTKGWSFKYI